MARFSREILRLHQQGLCTAAISMHLGVPSDFVRTVVREESMSVAARRSRAEAKKAEALRLLAEAESVLGR